MDLSIIIPSKNRLDLLQQCINSLWRHCGRNYRVVVVDTGDGEEAKWARQNGLSCLHLPGANYARANNEAVKAFCRSSILCLNNDIIVTNNLIAAFSRGKARNHGRIIGARLLYPDGLIQHAGVGFDQDGGPYNLWRYGPAEHPEAIKPRSLPAVTFACAMIPLHLWRQLGGMDEGYTNSYEDVDLCLRARELGYSVMYDPTITAIHLEGQTEGRNDGVEASWRYYQETWLATGRIRYALGQWPFSAVR